MQLRPHGYFTSGMGTSNRMRQFLRLSCNIIAGSIRSVSDSVSRKSKQECGALEFVNLYKSKLDNVEFHCGASSG